MRKRMARRVTLQYLPPDSVDAHGHDDSTWTDYRTCFADIREKRGREGERGDQMEHHGNVEVEIVHPRDGRFPVVQDRATWFEADSDTTRTVDIAHIERVSHQRRRLVLHCTEVG